ncbi:MAG TPA: DUF4178 domain-containing protein [Bryobacteraceae bacterium]|nr:DUF4178 domain-containing protein [Bryobacteraceae bacterium]
MSQPRSNCPNCGAPVEFRFSSAVQTTCPYCSSILVRTDVDLKKVGEVADLPPEVSPIQLLTEGVWRDKSFRVVGRIIYRYEQGYWNEWHCATHQGESIWLSDAMAEYAVSQLVQPTARIPAAAEVQPGTGVEWNSARFSVTSVNRASYLGVEGELPFEYWDKTEMVFADLRNNSAKFGTIDYSESPPLLFIGEFVDFDSLKLKNLREFEGW